MDIERFLKKLKIKLPYDQAVSLLGIYPEKNIAHMVLAWIFRRQSLSKGFCHPVLWRNAMPGSLPEGEGMGSREGVRTIEPIQKNVTKLATTWLKWNWVPSYRAVFIEVHRLLLRTIHIREEGSRWSVPPRLPLAHCPQAAFGPVLSSWTLNPSWLPAASVTSASKGKTRVKRWAEHRAHLRCDVMGLCLQEVRSR